MAQLGGGQQLVSGLPHGPALFGAEFGQEHGLQQTVHLQGVRPGSVLTRENWLRSRTARLSLTDSRSSGSTSGVMLTPRPPRRMERGMGSGAMLAQMSRSWRAPGLFALIRSSEMSQAAATETG
ncbi:hypothetical protein SHKM778_26680 [Streptomyces sp. KM77-8]|uniref:Uncharacterized protein n=1 Tax=Streptomyces haneummycinicus TaxID=3074435 RepID=A0AAT9HFS6_9ACTN